MMFFKLVLVVSLGIFEGLLIVSMMKYMAGGDVTAMGVVCYVLILWVTLMTIIFTTTKFFSGKA